MGFLWPHVLRLLGFIPLFIVIYLWGLRRRSRFAARYSALTFVRDANSCPSHLRRHLPFILFIGALLNLVIAFGRPIVPEAILSGRTTIILALDISRSMCMQDILPNRLEVAKSAALSFIDHPVLGTQVGVVAFSGFAELALEPTTNPDLLRDTIESLTTATQTAIGSAILESLDAIAEVDPRVPASEEISVPSTGFPDKPHLPPLKPSQRDYMPHVIVLLTDGESNTGPLPLSAAQQAAERGIRIYAIGFGTSNAAIMDCWNRFPDIPPSTPAIESQLGVTNFDNGPDVATLKQIAEITGGEFYSATSAAELQTVFQKLHQYIAMTNKTVEVSVLFTALGALLMMTAVLLSFFWHPLL